MKTCIYLILLMIFNVHSVWTLDLRGADYVGDVGEGWINFIDDEKLKINIAIDGKYSEICSAYKIRELGEVPFLYWGERQEFKFLILYATRICFIFKGENDLVMMGINYGGTKKPNVNRRIISEASLITKAAEYTATSSLKEGDRYYSPTNLGEIRPGNPWVEGAKGAGIGEKITTKWNIKKGGIKALIFANGYVSYNKPNLFLQNNRVKRLRLSNESGQMNFFVDLNDTPNPQIFILPVETHDVTFEIISVYEGSRWDDTCINFILGISPLLSDFLKD